MKQIIINTPDCYRGQFIKYTQDIYKYANTLLVTEEAYVIEKKSLTLELENKEKSPVFKRNGRH